MPSLSSRLIRATSLAYVRGMRLRAGGPLRPGIQIGDIDVQRMRDDLERVARFTRLPRGTSTAPVEVAGVPCEWVDAPGVDRDRVVLYVHGGAHCLCSPRTHRGITAALSAAAEARVLVPEYRLAPEAPYPASREDVAKVYRELLARGYAPGRVALAGDSSGGGLAVSLLVELRDAGDPLPACAALLSPWVDLTGSGDSIWERARRDPWVDPALMYLPAGAYAGEVALDDPGVSPLFADLQGLPPLLVHVGSEEAIHDDAVRLVERAREAGVDASVGIWHGMWHVFHAFPGTPERRRALRELGGFVRRHTT